MISQHTSLLSILHTGAVIELQLINMTYMLPCRLSASRLQRHSASSDIIKGAWSSAGFDCQYGKSPDDMRMFPFSREKCLNFYSTCVDSFPISAFTLTAIEPGSTAHTAEISKSHKLCGG